MRPKNTIQNIKKRVKRPTNGLTGLREGVILRVSQK